MSTAFVAVIRAHQVPAELVPGLTGSGAGAVHCLLDLAACSTPDDAVAVLLDPRPDTAGGALTTMLSLLDGLQVDGLVVATVRPVTDTLKRVGVGGALTGTADREGHRFVGAPIATRLGLLRAALEKQPDAVTAGEILASLVGVGATVVAA